MSQILEAKEGSRQYENGDLKTPRGTVTTTIQHELAQSMK